MRRTLTAQAGLLTGSRAFGQACNALTGIFVVRALSQFDYGTYRQLLLLWSTLIVLGDLSLSQTLFRFIPGQRENAPKYIGQALLVTLGTALAWTAGLVLLANPLGRFFGNNHLAEHMLLLAAYLGLSLLALSPETALINLERVGSVALNTAAFEGLKLALVVTVVFRGGGIAWLLRVMAFSAALKLLHLLWTLRDQFTFASGRELGVQTRYAMALWLPGLLNVAGTYAHQYIVGYYFDPAVYAVYAVACFQVPLIGILSSSVAEVLLVRATEYHAQGRREELYQVWLTAHRKAQMVILPFTIGCVALARPLLNTLFTTRYNASVPLFMIIVSGLWLNGIFEDGLFRAYGAMRAYAFFYFLRIAVALGLGVLGARWLGLWGVALSALATLVILNGSQLWMVARLLKVSYARVLPWKDLGRIGLFSAAAASLAAATSRLFTWAPAALAAGGVVFGAGYLAIGYWMGLLTKEEMQQLVDQVRSGLSRFGILQPGVTEP
jgi:O-antigen/teichoic acid export membrane protein